MRPQHFPLLFNTIVWRLVEIAPMNDAVNERPAILLQPPWQAIKEWIPDDDPDLDWFNRSRNPNEPDPDWFDQTPTWKAPEIRLEDGRTLVLEST